MAPIPVAARSKVCVCGSKLAGIVGLNHSGGHGCLSVVNVVFCEVEASVETDPSSRGVLQSVVCLSVISKIQQ